MSIEEIKSIKKLKEMLRLEIMDNKYLKECCEKAGIELAKNSFEWDGKPKNLVVYALELNTIIDQLKAENKELKEELDFQKNMYECARADEEDKFEEILELKEENEYNETNAIEFKQTLTEIKKVAEPYQKDIDKICGNCRRYDSCHACCMDTLNNYEYRTGTTKACDKFIELKDFDINKLANQILHKISEVEHGNF